MILNRNKILVYLTLLFLVAATAFAAKASDGQGSKKLDLLKWHDVGNIWLRVSNHGFFGSGDDIIPRYPSLEYPGGSGIDYLYQGALWFGAKKIRRNSRGKILYWTKQPGSGPWDPIESVDTIPHGFGKVLDTLTTVGFDGDADLYEFLPAYNPLETSALGSQYQLYNPIDTIMSASIREHRRGYDDDGDGLVDEDPIGYGFPFRVGQDLPSQFSDYGSIHYSTSGYRKLHETEEIYGVAPIYDNIDIWFPLGFVYLGDKSNSDYNFTQETDDDGDGFYDEDGYPVSEQDLISYYYDYSPFGTPGQRDFGGSKSSNNHVPLNVRVRQMSYQWSYEYIKNLVYVEFDITNMNETDTLYDCAMGVYMDSDVGPQPWGNEKAADDASSYVTGEGYEFAYTYDADFDNGLSTGYVGSRVCTPDPEQLDFACWTWAVGQGPDDSKPLEMVNPSQGISNEKYWLLTGKNPNDDFYISLRDEPDAQTGEGQEVDTRYLFAFYGDQQGAVAPTDSSWNLAPGETMKIVIGVFPGDTVEELKQTASWAKTIYGDAQTITTAVEPDTFPHYQPPEPPAIPKMVAELDESGNKIEVFWDNRSQFTQDYITVTRGQLGWQEIYPSRDSYIANYDEDTFPEEFAPEYDDQGNLKSNDNAIVNPWTAHRLQHDFQGYSLWGRTGSGSQEQWTLKDRWDKIETDVDYEDYDAAYNQSSGWIDLGGNTGIDKGLPNEHSADAYDTNYYKYDENYKLVNIEEGETIYGYPIYNHEIEYSDSLNSYAEELSHNDAVLLFKNPDIGRELYLKLYDDKLIPLSGHSGENAIGNPERLEELRKDRLARRYYKSEILNPKKGIEYYIAVTAWDRGMPSQSLAALESGRDADANMKVIFPGPAATNDMDEIYVVPNPYLGLSNFDGRRENDEKGDKSRRIWFVNLPERAQVKIYTLAGDLVDEFDHNGSQNVDIITVSKAAKEGIAASGIHPWDILSRNDQIISSGVYLFSVKNKENDEIKVGKFVIIR